MRGGEQVTEGDGHMLVIAVGPNSEWGQTMALVAGEAADTPLQEKLTVLAGAIGKVGFLVALLCFIVLMIRCHLAPLQTFYPDNSGTISYVRLHPLIVTIVVIVRTALCKNSSYESPKAVGLDTWCMQIQQWCIVFWGVLHSVREIELLCKFQRSCSGPRCVPEWKFGWYYLDIA